jgi:hypothetical protein
VKVIHPLIWGLLKQWNMIRQETDRQRSILIHLVRVLESDMPLARSDEMEFFAQFAKNKRHLLTSILHLKKMIIQYQKINIFLQ